MGKEQSNLKACRRKKIIRIRGEISEIENRKTIDNITVFLDADNEHPKNEIQEKISFIIAPKRISYLRSRFDERSVPYTLSAANHCRRAFTGMGVKGRHPTFMGQKSEQY